MLALDSNDESFSPFIMPQIIDIHNLMATESNKVELFDSSRPLNQGGFLDQKIPALGATKRKNLKRKVSRPPSSHLGTSKRHLISNRSLPYFACSCQDRKDILVVDDNIFNILTLQTIIECTLKLQTDKALNGKEAVEKVMRRADENQKNPCNCKRLRTNYKLIFMDCNMPIMDGFEATYEIRKKFSQKNIHIAALTAYASE